MGNLPQRLSSPPHLMLHAVVTLAVLGTGAIVGILWIRPHEDNAALIAAVLGFLGPTTAALLALLKASQAGDAVKALEVKIDGRLDQLLEQTAKAAKSEGREESLAPNVAAAVTEAIAPMAASVVAPAVAAAVVPAVTEAVVPAVAAVVAPAVSEEKKSEGG